jgi:hypothetical protein
MFRVILRRKKNLPCFLKSIAHLVLVIEMQFVFCEVETAFLNVI